MQPQRRGLPVRAHQGQPVVAAKEEPGGDEDADGSAPREDGGLAHAFAVDLHPERHGLRDPESQHDHPVRRREHGQEKRRTLVPGHDRPSPVSGLGPPALEEQPAHPAQVGRVRAIGLEHHAVQLEEDGAIPRQTRRRAEALCAHGEDPGSVVGASQVDAPVAVEDGQGRQGQKEGCRGGGPVEPPPGDARRSTPVAEDPRQHAEGQGHQEGHGVEEQPADVVGEEAAGHALSCVDPGGEGQGQGHGQEPGVPAEVGPQGRAERARDGEQRDAVDESWSNPLRGGGEDAPGREPEPIPVEERLRRGPGRDGPDPAQDQPRDGRRGHHQHGLKQRTARAQPLSAHQEEPRPQQEDDLLGQRPGEHQEGQDAGARPGRGRQEPRQEGSQAGRVHREPQLEGLVHRRRENEGEEAEEARPLPEAEASQEEEEEQARRPEPSEGRPREAPGRRGHRQGVHQGRDEDAVAPGRQGEEARLLRHGRVDEGVVPGQGEPLVGGEPVLMPLAHHEEATGGQKPGQHWTAPAGARAGGHHGRGPRRILAEPERPPRRASRARAIMRACAWRR